MKSKSLPPSLKCLAASALLSLLFGLAGCGNPAVSTGSDALTSSAAGSDASDSSSSSSQNEKNYYKASEINKEIDFNRMDGAVPTKGEEEFLVVPVDFSDYKFKDSELAEIKTLHGGTPAETKYWESLGSFYEKSSFGQLKLSFEYADTYHVNKTAEAFATDPALSSADSGWIGCLEVLRGAVKQYKNKHGSAATKKFDKDGDGFLDAVIMIYACPNNQDPAIAAYDEEGAYWAYRWADYGATASVDSPVGFNFFWASLDFFYADTGTRASHSGVDAHTLIHETGHLLGADDYYNTATATQSGGSSHETKSPAGGVMMMDANRTDHDAFTKMSYGWIKPYVVTGSTEITIAPSQDSGDAIVLADHWNGSAFDEYIALELYTPTGLNAVDAARVDYTQAGVRMLHIDARLAKATGYNGNTGSFVNPSYVGEDEAFDYSRYQYYVPARNSAAEDMAPAKGKNYDLVSLISSKGRSFSEDDPSTEADLFHTGDSFSLADASSAKCFATRGKLNNGNALPYRIEMVSVSATAATIRFTKTA